MPSYSSQLARAARAPGSYTQSALRPLGTRMDFDTNTGVGNRGPASAGTAGEFAETRVEECAVWSEVLVTEAGVFELPPGWPDTNAYPGLTFPDADLPELGAAHVLQRRTHAYAYSTEEGAAAARHLLAAYAKPLSYAGQPVAFPAAGRFAPVVKASASARVRAGAKADAALVGAVSALLGMYGAQVA
jgi:hypothetical protein